MSAPGFTKADCVAIQEAVVALLGTRQRLRGVPILARRRTTIANDIQAAVDSLGACLYVFPALPRRVAVNGSSLYVDEWDVRVQCIENTTLNTALPDCFELVEEVLVALHQVTFPQLNQLNCLVARDTPVEEVPHDSLVVHDVVFTTSGGLRPS